MPKFGTKSALFRYFWARILKNYCHSSNQHLRIRLIAKFCEKTKMPIFGNKNALFGCFWARIYKKGTIVIFEASTLEFVKLQNIVK